MKDFKRAGVLVKQIKEDLDEYVGCKAFSDSPCSGGGHLGELAKKYEVRLEKLFSELKSVV